MRAVWVARVDMARNPLNPRGPYKKRPVIDRLLARCKRDPETGCLVWQGGIGGQMGYGVIGIDGQNRYVHRVMYEHHHGPIPAGQLVCHECDNPVCCEPNHLFLGTHKVNTQDAIAKGRIARGERAGSAKLTEAQVLEIKRRLKAGNTHSAIAKDFGVVPSVITRINTGAHWCHVKE